MQRTDTPEQRDRAATTRRGKDERARALLDELAKTERETAALGARRRELEAQLRTLYPRDFTILDRSILSFLSAQAGRAVSMREIHHAIASARPTAWKTVQRRLLALRDAGYVVTTQAIGRGGTHPHWLLADPSE
jgi:hypothetical protein